MIAKVAVIGSNSFSGATFVRYLIDNGFDVLLFSRSSEYHHAFLPYKWTEDALGRCRFIQADLNKDLGLIDQQLDEFQPEYVVNFASQSMVGESWLYPVDWYRTNVISQVALHESLREKAYLKKYVHISTPEVYGSCSGVVREDASYNPSTPYATSRAACDMHLMNYFNNYNFPVVFTRAANVYGPGQQLYRIIPRTVLYCKLNKKLPLHGGGHSVRSFINMEDVSSATASIMQNGSSGNIFHISTDRFIAIRDLVALICSKMGRDFNDIVEITEDRPGKDDAYTLDSSKVEKEFCWKTKISLEEGVDQTIQWVEKYFDQLMKQPQMYIHKA